ncbi:hypothetical protein [Pseudomonas sp. MWU13-2105]|uniref:hypothetical protein n=1 Tax=Pseudomonas sp. MWU13-2105 TaxID=2935074 RepID=UPI00200CF953|nr:hypothetical protein [Pseudomonas sp. MWU13-2105]
MKIMFAVNLYLLIAGMFLGDGVLILLCVNALSSTLIHWREEKGEHETFKA